MNKKQKTRLKEISVGFFLLAVVITIIKEQNDNAAYQKEMYYEMPVMKEPARGFDYDKQEWIYNETPKATESNGWKPEPLPQYSKRERDMIEDYIENNSDDIIDEYGD